MNQASVEVARSRPEEAAEPARARPEVSFVIPCLNEAETLAACIAKARQFIETSGVAAEIVVADNGSTDGSREIARAAGARVISVREKGYGNALLGGVAAARGTYVIMGDADDSYNFAEVWPFLEKLREGYDLVMGNRLAGRVMPGAMPWTHRWIGNPVLTGLGRLFFAAPVGDFHSGLRAFRRDAIASLRLSTTGMEFASEMVIKATLQGLRIAEVPITLYRDGRSRPPHLRSFHDGWRHLRFMLLFSPRWLFIIPGLVSMALGFLLMLWLLPGPQQLGRFGLDVHTMLVAGLMCTVGFEIVCFGIFTKVFAVTEGLLPEDRWFHRFFRMVTLEVGLLIGAGVFLAGLLMLVASVLYWQRTGFGALPYGTTLRLVIPATTLLALGTEMIFSSFFLSVLGLGRRHRHASSSAI